MYAHLAQIDLFNADFIQQVGAPAFVSIITAITVLYVARGWYKRENTDAETQSTVTHLLPNLSSQVGELQKEVNRLNNRVIDLKDDVANEREKRIVTQAEHSRDKAVSDLKIQHLENTVKQHERKIAILEKDKQEITDQRNRYRDERDKLSKQVIDQKEKITIIEAQYEVLNRQVDEYRIWQQKEDTQKIPELPDIEDATIRDDGTLTTPVIEQSLTEPTDGNPADDTDNDENQPKEDIA